MIQKICMLRTERRARRARIAREVRSRLRQSAATREEWDARVSEIARIQEQIRNSSGLGTGQDDGVSGCELCHLAGNRTRL